MGIACRCKFCPCEMDMEFRTVGSVERITAVMETCAPYFHDQRLNNKTTIASLAEKFSRHAVVVAAYVEEQIAGFIAYYNNDPTNTAGFVSMITVCGGHQGKRIGSALFDIAVKDCRDKKLRQLRLEVADDNQKATAFYLKKGFERVGPASEKSSFYILQL